MKIYPPSNLGGLKLRPASARPAADITSFASLELRVQLNAVTNDEIVKRVLAGRTMA